MNPPEVLRVPCTPGLSPCLAPGKHHKSLFPASSQALGGWGWKEWTLVISYFYEKVVPIPPMIPCRPTLSAPLTLPPLALGDAGLLCTLGTL